MPLLRLRAPEAVYELIDLLKLAHSAVNRAREKLDGEAANLASRLASQLCYLRGVSDLLEHEATRAKSSASGTEVGPARLSSTSLALIASRDG